MFDGMVGRLPIFNRSLDLFGYELRFCSGEALRNGGGDDEARWSETVREANAAVPLSELVGNSRALVRVPPSVLGTCEEWTWPREQIVLVLPGAAVDDPVAGSAATRLARAGYTVALQNPACDLTRLRKLADYVSMCAVDAGTLVQADLDWLRRHERRLQLLVRDVETHDDFERYSTLGFDYYEGAFIERPRRVRNCDIPGNRAALLDLVAKLQNPHIAIAEAEDLISRDMVLSYKLLRLLNSAFFGGGKPVESIRRAVMFFGLGRVKNWATVILMGSVEYKPRELLTMATIRARVCELLAQKLGRPNPEHYYIAGLFSLLDAIIDLPREQILESLRLADPIMDALLAGEGPVGEVLRTALAFERADAAQIARDGLLPDGVPAYLYLEAIHWANDLRLALAA